MSFRLQIFVLVMVVALTAIGATAWLALSLASGEIERSQEAQVRHQTDIVEAVQRYGLGHGYWPGVDTVVADLSQHTDLHVQLRTADGEVVADSDTIAGQPSGLVRGAALGIDPRPELAVAAAEPGSPIMGFAKPPLPEKDLFGATPTGGFFGSPPALMLRQLAQYRAALLTVRCLKKEKGTEPGLLIDQPPYLTPAEVQASPECVGQAVAEVAGDPDWLSDVWNSYNVCASKTSPGASDECLSSAFRNAVTPLSAIPLQLYLGGRTGADLDRLGRPAAFGAAGLVLVAIIGTALIARQVSRPVRRLTDASGRLADGRLDARVPTRGRSELAQLSASFNAMAEAVQRSEERQRRLIADVAHELRTPLSNLRGYLEGLSDGVVEPSRELFSSLHEETMLQRRILDDLQILALAEAGELGYTMARTDLADLASATALAHRAVAAEEGVALTVDAPSPVPIDGDADRLRQVLGNLLTNAIRYTDRGGHVLVRVRGEGGTARLTVQDTGVGIAAGDVSHVFDRFWRADPTRQRATGGTGLGLTIAHQIVTDHGGRIEVTSRPHIGTTFTVDLPLI